MTPAVRALRVAVVGLVVHVVIVVLLLVAHGDPAWFVHFGSTEAGRHGAVALGADVPVVGPHGHDGQAFWALARDPLLLHPDRVAADLDRPVYRAQRILYPALAAPWLAGGEGALLWGMLAVNLAVVLGGGYLAARLAIEVGAPDRAGLAFALNPLVLVATVMDFADGLALAALVGAVLAVRRERWGWAVAAGVAAVLAKESSGAALLAIAVLAPGLPRARRVAIVAVPAAAALAWGVYVRARFDWRSTGVQEFTAVPFRGYVGALRDYYPDRSSAADLLVAFLLVPLAIYVVVRWWQRRNLLMTAALPFALIVPFLAAPVLYLPLNSVRAIGPAVTFLVIDLYASGAVTERAAPSSAGVSELAT